VPPEETGSALSEAANTVLQLAVERQVHQSPGDGPWGLFRWGPVGERGAATQNGPTFSDTKKMPWMILDV